MSESIKAIFTLIGLVVLPTPSISENINEDVQTCLKTPTASERLKCYDTVFGFENAPNGDVEAKLSREWVFEEKVDGFDGSNISRVYLEGFPVDGENIEPNMRLYLICDGEGDFNIAVETLDFLGSSQNLRVRYKFDDESPITEGWIPAASGQAVWLPKGYRDFRSRVDVAAELLFEITAFNGVSYQSKFTGMLSKSPEYEFVTSGCV